MTDIRSSVNLNTGQQMSLPYCMKEDELYYNYYNLIFFANEGCCLGQVLTCKRKNMGQQNT